MDRSARSEHRDCGHLSKYLPIRARMRPSLHRNAQGLVRNNHLPPECLVTAIFELNNSIMCCVQFGADGTIRQTLVVPLTEITFDRRHRITQESVVVRARATARGAIARSIEVPKLDKTQRTALRAGNLWRGN